MVGKKNLIANALHYSGTSRLLRMARSWRGVIVLNYHRVGDPGSTLFDRGVWSASAEDFDTQLTCLATHCDVIGLQDLDRALLDRRGRYALITFDDGYRDNYDVAFPMLKHHRLPALFCITTGFLDEQPVAWWDEIAWMVRSSPRTQLPPTPWTAAPLDFDEPHRDAAIARLIGVFKQLAWSETDPFLDTLAELTGSGRGPRPVNDPIWMTWDMVRELQQAGMGIAGHTVHHPILARLSPEQQWEEVRGCKARLETVLGIPVESFSYPVGAPDSFDAATRDCLERAGYRWAFSFSGGYTLPGHADRLDIPRTAIHPHVSLRRLEALLTLPQLFA